MRLSAILIGRDEAWMVRPCLERLAFADEIVVVVDSRSNDDTERLAREFTDNVYVRDFDSFSGQRNYAIEKAEGDWILMVDFDERVTPALAGEIEHAIASPGSFVGFSIPMAHFGFGKQLRHGGWRESPPRLMRRESVRYRGDVDEVPELAGPTGTLSAELWHFSHRDTATMLEKISIAAPLAAERMLNSHEPPVTGRKLLAATLSAFFRRTIRLRGFRDGIEGLIQASYYSFGTFCVHVILWEKQRRPTLEDTYVRLEARATEERPARVHGRFLE